jgi:hypothetical protein
VRGHREIRRVDLEIQASVDDRPVVVGERIDERAPRYSALIITTAEQEQASSRRTGASHAN